MARRNRKKIKYRAPYEIPAVSNYRFAAKWFIRRVEFYLKLKNKELEHLGDDPEKRKEYLKSVIDTEFAKKSRKCKKIYNSDLSRLNKAIKRRKSDKEEFSNLLSTIYIEIASLSEEYIAIEKLYKKYNPLYKGELKVGRLNTDGNAEDSMEGDDVDE